MGKVQYLRVPDHIEVNRGQLDTLCGQIGPQATEEVVCRAMEELAVRLGSISTHLCDGEAEPVAKLARSMVGIADQVGLVTLATAARNLSDAAASGDHHAMTATGVRLARVGDSSLLEVFCIQGLSI